MHVFTLYTFYNITSKYFYFIFNKILYLESQINIWKTGIFAICLLSKLPTPSFPMYLKLEVLDFLLISVYIKIKKRESFVELMVFFYLNCLCSLYNFIFRMIFDFVFYLIYSNSKLLVYSTTKWFRPTWHNLKSKYLCEFSCSLIHIVFSNNVKKSLLGLNI